MLYRVDDQKQVVPVLATTTRDEALREVDLEDWVERAPEILDEELLIVGRQVEVDAGRDRLDLLALDLDANLVVIELKRDLIGGDADLQALRYAAMIAHWTDETVRGLAENYWRSSGQDRDVFTKEVDDFCDAGYEVNGSQRILLVGRNVHPRVATMALWLRQTGIDIRVLSMDLYRDGERLYLTSQTIIPLPTEHDVAAQPQPAASDKEWRRDGPAWHLEEQLADDGRAILEHLISILREGLPDAEGPHWPQKNYVTWRSGGRNWMRAYTDNPHQVSLMLYGLAHLPLDEISERLGLPTQDKAESHEVSRIAPGRSPSHVWINIKTLEDLTRIEPEIREIFHESWQHFAGQA